MGRHDDRNRHGRSSQDTPRRSSSRLSQERRYHDTSSNNRTHRHSYDESHHYGPLLTQQARPSIHNPSITFDQAFNPQPYIGNVILGQQPIDSLTTTQNIAGPLQTNVYFPSQAAPVIWPAPFMTRTLPPPIPPETRQGLDLLDGLQLPSSQITDRGIIPNTPYCDLPAGLMVPLVHHSRTDFEPIDPSDLRLPLPRLPDEKFLRSIDNFYSNDSKMRDGDGWDHGFIDIYLGQKKSLSKNTQSEHTR